MKVSISKIILLSAILIVLVSVSGSLFANAQTEVDKDPAGQSSAASGSSAVSSQTAPSSSSALDANAPVAAQPVANANDTDFVAPRPAGVLPTASMWFKYVAGSAFYPRNSTYTFAESGSSGCIYQTGGASNGVFVADVQFPEGAVIDILRLFYYDTSSNNSGAWITQYDGAGGMLDIAYAPSTGESGYGNSAKYLVRVVANYNHPLVLNWRSNQPGPTIMLCGMRIRYWMNASLFYLPAIMNNSH
jgi:hypothetical protein